LRGLSPETGFAREYGALAFTIAPHLQTINYRGGFSPMAGI
jgi:hypothetical protein